MEKLCKLAKKKKFNQTAEFPSSVNSAIECVDPDTPALHFGVEINHPSD
jgi:hypothetical protein